MPRIAVANAAELFRSETAEARRLGFQLQCRIGEASASARMQPRSPRALAACRDASGQPHPAIEATVEMPEPSDQADRLREAITAVLGSAREVMA